MKGRVAVTAGFLFLVGAISFAVNAQAPHPDAKLPEVKGSWVIEQKYKTIFPGTVTPGYIYVIVQSDGVVYRRSYLENLRAIGPWCRDEFGPAQMRSVRGAIQGTRSESWGAVYGNFINIYAPWKTITLTVREPSGGASQSRTKILRFNGLPADLVRLTGALDDAGLLALSDCNRTLAKMNMPQYRF